VDAPRVKPTSARIFQRQAGDLAVTAEDDTSGRVTSLEGQRD
jgi:hypothetical protein